MDIATLKTELEEYGFVIIPNLIPEDEARGMAERLMHIMRQQPDADRPDQGLRGVFNYDPENTFVPLVTNPVCLELARHMLGEDFQMAEAGCRWLKPGAPGQGLHADVPMSWFPQQGLPVPDVCFFVNFMWMLTDFTHDNGATLVLPFSHHARRLPRKGVDYRYLLPAEGPAGSLVVFHGALWHKGGANVTADQHRVGLSSGYHANWMDPRAGQWHLMKRSVRDKLPPEVQALNRHVVD